MSLLTTLVDFLFHTEPYVCTYAADLGIHICMLKLAYSSSTRVDYSTLTRDTLLTRSKITLTRVLAVFCIMHMYILNLDYRLTHPTGLGSLT